MIDRYDPEVTPDPAEWLALDEGERIQLVEAFHREARIPLPKSARALHAAIHAVVENQLAMDDQAIVRDTLQRLLEDGLTRHDALHAIGSVLAERIADAYQESSGTTGGDES
ncbi:hypothetical protein SKTS_27560 [Sulfurimicrobium lacus]|uniref:Uncharacterized protein n=1 Tax=Sulfurimicrobium lacus TaxID=2715678 RepID=A0A6F8VEV3_9PROT|nr:DUF1841 family protein [Sulfurimicrobium lacus]BCB27870.1 hypothetical protein SKTS_27560 [Sulfurimicrobium lacus]